MHCASKSYESWSRTKHFKIPLKSERATFRSEKPIEGKICEKLSEK